MTIPKFDEAEFRAQLSRTRPDLERLRASVITVIDGELRNLGLKILPIQSRIKDADSAAQKIKDKGYADPFEEITDLVGIRIISYLESDIEKIRESLTRVFSIDHSNSVDKREPSSPSTVGYRSLHLICSLGKHRNKLPEYDGLCDLRFEVQVRTALEHTWAEIEHRQNYKSDRSLPYPLQRRLNVISGTLELIDRELASIAQEALDYEAAVTSEQSGINEDQLTVSSLMAVLRAHAEKFDFGMETGQGQPIDLLLNELNIFGVDTVSELKHLIDSLDLRDYPGVQENEIPLVSVIRTAMVNVDAERFLRDIYGTENDIPEKIIRYLSNGKIDNQTDFINHQKQRHT